MNKQLLFLLIIIFNLNCYSQISFEKGYYIDNNDERINCLIKNNDWKNNPTEFEYRLSENDETKKKNIESIKQFGIDNGSKYIRKTLKIDRSSETLNELSKDRNPIFKEEELFLKVLVEGKANLYLYEERNFIRFFFSSENSDTEQLIYKSYKNKDEKIGKNNSFKNQLWNNLKCPEFNIRKVENLDYRKNDLIDFFAEYNACHGEKNINYEEKQKKDLINLNMRAGFNSSSLSATGIPDFDNQFTFRFGVEAEFIMPFNKNKWSVIIEPTYQYYKSKQELTNQSVEAIYNAIEIPVGIRHYLFLNENSKVFINGALIFNVTTNNSTIDFEFGPDLNIETSHNYAFGVGFKHNDKYSLELRHHTSRDLLTKYRNRTSDYRTFSVILGYSLF